MSPVLPPDDGNEQLVNSGMQIPKWLDDAIRQIADVRGKSRNWVIKHFLTWALNAHREEERQMKAYDARETAASSPVQEEAKNSSKRQARK